MHHVIEHRNQVTILRVQEDLGSQNAGPFRNLVDSVSELGYERVVLDFSGVHFISSMAISALFAIYRKLRDGGGGLTLVGVGHELGKIFELVGLHSLVRIFPSEKEALEFLTAGDA